MNWIRKHKVMLCGVLLIIFTILTSIERLRLYGIYGIQSIFDVFHFFICPFLIWGCVFFTEKKKKTIAIIFACILIIDSLYILQDLIRYMVKNNASFSIFAEVFDFIVRLTLLVYVLFC